MIKNIGVLPEIDINSLISNIFYFVYVFWISSRLLKVAGTCSLTIFRSKHSLLTKFYKCLLFLQDVENKMFVNLVLTFSTINFTFSKFSFLFERCWSWSFYIAIKMDFINVIIILFWTVNIHMKSYYYNIRRLAEVRKPKLY